ncbi:MAG: hypothetical protein HY966_06795 [Ignavibacteriales bacterium]|nr:hypothetical protein [Ignavibacteriales bacterium]
MNEKKYVIGLDGGGTKTTAEVLDLDGTCAASTLGERSNFQIVGVEKASQAIQHVVLKSCESAKCRPQDIAAIVAGLTGAGRASDQQRMEQGIQEVLGKLLHASAMIKVESDARGALEGAHGGKPGIIVIAGTGSVVFGKDAKNKVHRAGGWGRLIDDEGSGHTIGREALRMVAKEVDGIGKPTKLTGLLAHRFDLDSQEAIITALYKNNFEIPSVAPLVMEAASGSDAVAQKILKRAAEELLGVIKAVQRKMGPLKPRGKKIPLAFIGSLLANDNWYSRYVSAAIKRELPAIALRSPQASPAYGAALMALRFAREER